MRMVTSSGNVINLLGEYRVDILDIATSLSNLPRWTGHCKTYSVAQHSVLVSHLVPQHLAFQGLMHDAHEYITGDISGPMKELLEHEQPGFWARIEARYATKVRRHFGLPSELHPEVSKVDKKCREYEAACLHTEEAQVALLNIGQKIDYSYPIYPVNRREAFDMFMKRFNELGPNVF